MTEEEQHENYCGPNRGEFMVCYCMCEKCRELLKCICPECRATPDCPGNHRK